jgi:hypothetical protein
VFHFPWHQGVLWLACRVLFLIQTR